MGAVTRSVPVHRPVGDVAKVALDPDIVLPTMGAFGRFDLIERNPDGSQEWDLYLRVGTIHVGGRVLVEPPSESELRWYAVRGTRHHARLVVSSADDGALVTMTVTAEFAGMATGWLTGVFANGILGRHMEAGLQQLRHRIEYGDDR
ncbi:SRPBCC family protein [Mycobacterium sp. M1]|uniref:SRPBCC family protein n=1 Tax=Mycolicibacter acidiphilus TaxID=2835306 RepID=A0ABS5RJE2_9MYCO|nr:SRPBCC family protein [Mycolicibacter acidiphilus]MBS9534423.1 SRPBCC family protein [Mycolicibacter acidiphilus]